MLTPEESNEWQSAALWAAKRGYTGKPGDPLPLLLSSTVYTEIEEYRHEFQAEIRAAKYMLSREKE